MEVQLFRLKLGDEARERVVDLYTMDKFVQNYEELYIRLLGDKK